MTALLTTLHRLDLTLGFTARPNVLNRPSPTYDSKAALPDPPLARLAEDPYV